MIGNIIEYMIPRMWQEESRKNEDGFGKECTGLYLRGGKDGGSTSSQSADGMRSEKPLDKRLCDLSAGCARHIPSYADGDIELVLHQQSGSNVKFYSWITEYATLTKGLGMLVGTSASLSLQGKVFNASNNENDACSNYSDQNNLSPYLMVFSKNQRADQSTTHLQPNEKLMYEEANKIIEKINRFELFATNRDVLENDSDGIFLKLKNLHKTVSIDDWKGTRKEVYHLLKSRSEESFYKKMAEVKEEDLECNDFDDNFRKRIGDFRISRNYFSPHRFRVNDIENANRVAVAGIGNCSEHSLLALVQYREILEGKQTSGAVPFLISFGAFEVECVEQPGSGERMHFERKIDGHMAMLLAPPDDPLCSYPLSECSIKWVMSREENILDGLTLCDELQESKAIVVDPWRNSVCPLVAWDDRVVNDLFEFNTNIQKAIRAPSVLVACDYNIWKCCDCCSPLSPWPIRRE